MEEESPEWGATSPGLGERATGGSGGSEGSCSECYCEACRGQADSLEDGSAQQQPQTVFTKLKDPPRNDPRQDEPLSDYSLLQTLRAQEAVFDSDTHILTMAPDSNNMTDDMILTPHMSHRVMAFGSCSLPLSSDRDSFSVTPKSDSLTMTPTRGTTVTPKQDSVTVRPRQGIFTMNPKDICTVTPRQDIFTVNPKDICTVTPRQDIFTVNPKDICTVTPRQGMFTVNPKDIFSNTPEPDIFFTHSPRPDAFTAYPYPDRVTPNRDFQTAPLHMDSKALTPDMDSVALTSGTCSPASCDSLTVAIEDLHVKRAQLRAKKQRRCAFCRIHGFSINVKGHKTLCQFREKCACRGCTLIKCTQRVSKNQVRLRRQKDLEMDIDATPLHSDNPEASKKPKSPMCFKCWVHDSVRVRLKGHRSLCPYVRCSCSNCALNTDRKFLTRQLRQLTTLPKEVEDQCASLETLAALYPSPAIKDHLFSSPGFQHFTTSGAAPRKDDTDRGVYPVRLFTANNWHLGTDHTVNDWHVGPGFSSISGVKQTATGGFSPIQTQNGPLVEQQASHFVPPLSKKWQPAITSTTTSTTLANLPMASCGGTAQWGSSAMPVTTTTTTSSFHGLVGAAPSPGKPFERSGVYRWCPQRFAPPPPPPPIIYKTSSASLAPTNPSSPVVVHYLPQPPHSTTPPAFSFGSHCFPVPGS